MKRIKLLLCLCLGLLAAGCSFYDDYGLYDLPVLTLEQVLADYDYMTDVILDASPHIAVAETLYGIDPAARLAAIRNEITAGMTAADFFGVIRKALGSIHGHHMWPAYYAPLLPLWNSIDSVLLTNRIGSEYFSALYPPDAYVGHMNTAYLGGHYYTMKDYVMFGDTIPKGSEVFEIDGTDIGAFIDSSLECAAMTWSTAEGRFIDPSFYRHIFETMPGTHTFSIRHPDNSIRTLTRENHFITKEQFDAQQAVNVQISWGKTPVYFPDQRVMYMKLQMMQLTQSDELIKDLRSSAPGKAIDKMVIDIRSNPGGNDMAWRNLITYITGNPMTVEYTLGIRDSQYLRQRLDAFLFEGETKSCSFLNNTEYIVNSGTETLTPPLNPLNYSGPVYILVDNIYSSAGSFCEYAKQQDNIIVLGRPSGYLLGQGITPVMFTLPNSGINFTFEPLIDLSGVTQAVAVMHDVVEVPVEPTLDEILSMNNYSGDLAGEEYLFTYDVFMKKVMEQ